MSLSSNFTIGPDQADGRHYVKETHLAEDGRVFSYEYLNDGSLDPQMVLEERATLINAELAKRAAARAAVTGTEVPYTKHEFLSRFETPERIAIRERAKTDGVTLDFMEMLNASGGVYRTLAQPGIIYLKDVGILTEARVAEFWED